MKLCKTVPRGAQGNIHLEVDYIYTDEVKSPEGLGGWPRFAVVPPPLPHRHMGLYIDTRVPFRHVGGEEDTLYRKIYTYRQPVTGKIL